MKEKVDGHDGAWSASQTRGVALAICIAAENGIWLMNARLCLKNCLGFFISGVF
jgi:hypothetical protein